AASFAELLREAPQDGATVTLVGVLSHAAADNRFVLVGPGGEQVEVPVDAVRHHHVVRRIPAQIVVQVEVDAAKLGTFTAPKFWRDKAGKDPMFDGFGGSHPHKAHKDPGDDREANFGVEAGVGTWPVPGPYAVKPVWLDHPNYVHLPKFPWMEVP